MVRRRRRHGPSSDDGLDILASRPLAAAGVPAARAGDTAAMLSPADVLSAPALYDDLEAQLAARPPRAKLPKLTLALAAAVLIGVGFIGGLLLGKRSASAGGASGLPGLAGGAPAGGAASAGGGLPAGGAFPGGGGGAAGGFGGATIGTIKLVDGNTIYVQGFTGTITRVATSASTKIQISANGKLKDLHPGETVTVQGAKRSDGSVAATSVSQSSLGGSGGG